MYDFFAKIVTQSRRFGLEPYKICVILMFLVPIIFASLVIIDVGR